MTTSAGAGNHREGGPVPASGSGVHLAWPAEAFYWAEIDASALGRSPTHRQLLHLMEVEMPVRFEEVHAIFAPLGGGRHVGCAVERERLKRDVPADAVSLVPESVPAPFEGRVDRSRLQMLAGPFEPAAIRVARRGTTLLAAAIAVVSVSLAVVGVERRIRSRLDAVQSIESMRRAVMAEALGAGAAAPNADLLLSSELSRLRVTRRGTADADVGGPSQNVVPVVAGLLAAWPRGDGVAVMTESVSVTPRSITVSGTVPTAADAQTLADALATLGDRGGAGRWRINQPTIQSSRGKVMVTIRLDRQEAGP